MAGTVIEAQPACDHDATAVWCLPARGGRAVIGIAVWRRRGAWLESMAWVVWYIAYIEAMAVMRMDNGLKAPMPSLAR